MTAEALSRLCAEGLLREKIRITEGGGGRGRARAPERKGLIDKESGRDEEDEAD